MADPGHAAAGALVVLTFNILAPVYKVSGRRCEADEPERYARRLDKILEAIDAPGADDAAHVICLQEVWLANAEYMASIRARFSDRYALYENRRPGKADGLLTLIDTRLRVLDHRDYTPLVEGGTRVASLFRLDISAVTDAPGAEVVVLNTHLSFRASAADERARALQAKALCAAIDEACERAGAPTPAVVAGDLNGTNDAALVYIQGCAYSSALPVAGLVTHRTHERINMVADYVMLRCPDEPTSRPLLRITDAVLLPRALAAGVWPTYEAWSASDHRPLRAVLALKGE